jgi:hypothetical protein
MAQNTEIEHGDRHTVCPPIAEENRVLYDIAKISVFAKVATETHGVSVESETDRLDGLLLSDL